MVVYILLETQIDGALKMTDPESNLEFNIIKKQLLENKLLTLRKTMPNDITAIYKQIARAYQDSYPI